MQHWHTSQELKTTPPPKNVIGSLQWCSPTHVLFVSPRQARRGRGHGHRHACCLAKAKAIRIWIQKIQSLNSELQRAADQGAVSSLPSACQPRSTVWCHAKAPGLSRTLARPPPRNLGPPMMDHSRRTGSWSLGLLLLFSCISGCWSQSSYPFNATLTFASPRVIYNPTTCGVLTTSVLPYALMYGGNLSACYVYSELGQLACCCCSGMHNRSALHD